VRGFGGDSGSGLGSPIGVEACTTYLTLSKDGTTHCQSYFKIIGNRGLPWGNREGVDYCGVSGIRSCLGCYIPSVGYEEARPLETSARVPVPNPRTHNGIHRKVMCSHYSACPSVTVTSGWSGFSCLSGTDYVPERMDVQGPAQDSASCCALLMAAFQPSMNRYAHANKLQ
jgi:hypothetical protein